MVRASRRADCREQGVEQARTYQFGFAVYLSNELDYYGQEPTLAQTAAWEAMKGAREIARQGAGTDAGWR